MSDTKHRTNINLFSNDVAWLSHRYGYGWTEKVREIVHEHIKRHKEVEHRLGVLEEESVREYIKDKIERENPGKDFP